MKCSEIIDTLRQLAPESCACDWDNPGLLAGRSDKDVKKIYIALDATDQVVEAALEAGADMLLTHHPLIFKAIKQVNDQNFITRRLVKLIQADISYYAMHTNFDSAPGCMADLAAARLGILNTVPLETMGRMERVGEEETAYGIGKSGWLACPLTLHQLAEKVKKEFELPFVLVYGEELLPSPVERVSICPGAGGSEIEGALKWGAQVLITGDISHHQGIDSVARNMAVIDAGHYGLEHIFIPYMENYLREQLGEKEKLCLIQAPPAWPAVILA